LLEVEHLVVELYAAAAADDDVDLLLLGVGVAERNAEVRREPEVGQTRLLESERLAGEAGFEVRCETELRCLVLDVLEVRSV
jgi:hypothetical protein